MLADLLRDAIAQIDAYLAAWPGPPADWEPDVQSWLIATDILHRKLADPLWYTDYECPTPCRHCGLPAADHDVRARGLCCPVEAGSLETTFTVEEKTP